MTIEIHGYCDERFRPLRDAFAANFDDGLEIGASLAVTHQGKMVADFWAGWADRACTRPWEKDTIACVFSTTKAIAAIAFLMVLDRGLVDLDAPVARYWPEFAQGGKAHVTIRDAITHRGGVPGFEPAVPFEALYDWEGVTARLAAEPHWFDGDRVFCYHQMTYGFLLGEIIRRVDGRQPGRFFAEEIAVKVGADFHIGLTSKADFARTAELRHPDQEFSFPKSPLYEQVFASNGVGDWEAWDVLSADIPAGSGCGNGRSIARVCAIVAMGGELDGERYLSQEMIQAAGAEQIVAMDDYLGGLRFGLGFGLHSEWFPAPSPTSLHWGGYGGSWAVMDPAVGVSLGYVPNNMIADTENLETNEPRLARFNAALADVLSKL